jgi:alkylated DNA repair protein (DNA oxidative demethylase)
MATPRGAMSMAMTSCGTVGCTSDKAGYHYGAVDPVTGRPWPGRPAMFRNLAAQAAAAAGFAELEPDTCLLNEHESGARLSLHPDKDEPDGCASGRLRLAWTARYVRLRRREP